MVSFLDSNVLVYYVDSRDQIKQARAEGIIESALNGDSVCLISVQTLTEFSNVALGKLKLSQSIVSRYVEVFAELPVVTPDVKMLTRALEIKERYDIQFYDSMMLAAAERVGADEFLTEDLNDGQMYGTVKAVNPFK